MNKSEQVMLKVWERKVLRKIFGGKIWNGMWIRRPNVELERMYGEPNIVGIVKSQRLRWLGHIQRMPNTRLPKKILTGGIGGKKKKGRPKTRWKKDVEKDIEELKITNWKNKAANRRDWKGIVNQAMGLLGLES
ncbi:uncharacterized protein LOC126886518 [Diabrotica virgifera virgifera]|uniref:Endonuclease-reverse transcriptase n=1 Tax=Diabrotica virgifera virgifera TaxID=50390 RepID=A0ABM5KGX3_DIAVI|nr:uncharacterized protein LOC126886518 [Diabrotica virgifera virgifera]